MNRIINIYCDESCHLPNDRQKIMVLGAIWSPRHKVGVISDHLRAIKEKHGLSSYFEMKWTKVSPSKLPYFLDVVEYFFQENNLHFRALVINHKNKLDHDLFAQDHDDWYYKMFFRMLDPIIDPAFTHRIYLDIKDTRSQVKVDKLHDCLANAKYESPITVIERVQQIRSHESELLPLADLLIGAVGYINRGLAGSQAKLAVVNAIKKESNFSLVNTTGTCEQKFNVFQWKPNGVLDE